MQGPQESREAGTIPTALGVPESSVCPAGCVNTVTKRTDGFQGSADSREYSGRRGFPSSSFLLLSPQGRTGRETPGSLVRSPRPHSADLHSPWCGSHMSPPPGSTLGSKAMTSQLSTAPPSSVSSSLALLSYRACSVTQSCPTLCNPMDCSPLSVGFSRQEDWRGLTFPLPEDLPNPGTEPSSPARAGGFFITEPPGNPKPSLSALPYI